MEIPYRNNDQPEIKKESFLIFTIKLFFMPLSSLLKGIYNFIITVGPIILVWVLPATVLITLNVYSIIYSKIYFQLDGYDGPVMVNSCITLFIYAGFMMNIIDYSRTNGTLDTFAKCKPKIIYNEDGKIIW